MKLNIFSVPDGNVADLKGKFDQVGLEVIHAAPEGAWQTSFYFSKEQEPAEIAWVGTFAEFFGDRRPNAM